MLLLIATLIGPVGIKAALWILVPLTFWTALQRIQHVMKATRTP